MRLEVLFRGLATSARRFFRCSHFQNFGVGRRERHQILFGCQQLGANIWKARRLCKSLECTVPTGRVSAKFNAREILIMPDNGTMFPRTTD
jgi:hypothetical protein